MEAIHRDYSPKGVKFYYIYKALAHPETNGYVTPFTLEERLMHVKEAQRTLGSQFTWLCDTMSNDLKHRLGNAPNSEFIVGPDGKVVRRRAWSDPKRLRSDLEELVGKVENPTKESSISLGKVQAAKVAPTGIVPRVRVTSRMKAVKITPHKTDASYYVKLRAEADEQLLASGTGQLYLGFHLDPLYHVHWNNLVAPLNYELSIPDGVTVSAAKGDAPKVDTPTDSDPREFLIDIENGKSNEPIELTVKYFACNDDEGWCKPVTQMYTIRLEADADGGWVSKRYRVSPRGETSKAGNQPANRPNARMNRRPMAAQIMAQIKADDKNGDGKLTKEEASDRMLRVFDRMDSNDDGVIDQSEVNAMIERLRRARGGRRPGG